MFGKIRGFLAKPEYFYAVVALVFGTILVFVVPIGANSDEPAHYYRVQQIARFGVLASEEELREGIWLDEGEAVVVNQENFAETLNENKKIDYNHAVFRRTGQKVRNTGFLSAAVYSPMAYLPQVFGVWTGKVLRMSLNMEIYLMRFLGLIAQILLIFLAIKILPRGKWFLAIFALLPAMVAQSAAISGDIMTNCVVILFVSLFFALAVSIKPDRRLMLGFLTSTILLGMMKPPYFLLAAVAPFVLLVNKRLRSRGAIWVMVLATVAAFGIALCWNMAVGKVPIWAPVGVDMGGQIAHALANPLTPVVAFFNSIFVGLADFWRHATVSGVFMWGSTPLSPYFMTASVVAVTLAMYMGDRREVTGAAWERVRRWRWWGAGAGMAIVVAISAILYLKYTEVGGDNIVGVQGRYFLPLVPLVVIPFFAGKHNIRKVGIAITSVLCLAATIVTIMSRINFG